jgi:hypothetical protein
MGEAMMDVTFPPFVPVIARLDRAIHPECQTPAVAGMDGPVEPDHDGGEGIEEGRVGARPSVGRSIRTIEAAL